MSTEVTPESLRAHAAWLDDPRSPHYKENKVFADGLNTAAERLEREQRPLPVAPGWYPSIVVERGGESCTGALLTDEKAWITALPVTGCHHHYAGGTPRPTIRWAERDGKTPGQTLWEAFTADTELNQDWCPRYERIADAVLAAHGTPTLTPVGEHPEPGTRGLLPVVLRTDGWEYANGWHACRAEGMVARTILADPRPDGAHE